MRATSMAAELRGRDREGADARADARSAVRLSRRQVREEQRDRLLRRRAHARHRRRADEPRGLDANRRGQGEGRRPVARGLGGRLRRVLSVSRRPRRRRRQRRRRRHPAGRQRARRRGHRRRRTSAASRWSSPASAISGINGFQGSRGVSQTSLVAGRRRCPRFNCAPALAVDCERRPRLLGALVARPRVQPARRHLEEGQERAHPLRLLVAHAVDLDEGARGTRRIRGHGAAATAGRSRRPTATRTRSSVSPFSIRTRTSNGRSDTDGRRSGARATACSRGSATRR